jgi:hypothetical protein
MKQRYTRLLCVLATLLVVSAATPVTAAVPGTMNYQGRLTNAAGQNVTDGNYNVRFSLYDAASAGTVLWAESLSVVVTSGLFSVELGKVHAITGTLFSGADRWLGIAVASDPELTPRTKFATVAYAFAVDPSGSGFLPLSGGTMTGPITNTGNPSITMGKGNFGSSNLNPGAAAFVAGTNNRANGDYSAVTGGVGNYAMGSYSFVGGGNANVADSSYSTVAGGQNNVAIHSASFVGGGLQNIVMGPLSGVCSGHFNWAGDNPTDTAAVVGGGDGNLASERYSTIAGGQANNASGLQSTIGGGRKNTASGPQATIGGGERDTASNQWATVSGGANNRATGLGAMIPGGSDNIAGGSRSFAAGLGAQAMHGGSFVWADGTGGTFGSNRDNQVKMRANGGVWFSLNASRWVEFYDDGVDRLINASNNAYLSRPGVWTNNCNREAKENFTPVNGEQILEQIDQLPITRWNYKTDDTEVTHIGPVAQDFQALFKVGDDTTSISTLDPSGIALAGIKELHKENSELRAQNENLKKQLEALSQKVEKLAAGK